MVDTCHLCLLVQSSECTGTSANECTILTKIIARGYSRHDLDAVRLYETVTVLLCCQDRMPVLDLSAEPATAASCARAPVFAPPTSAVRLADSQPAPGAGAGRELELPRIRP